MKKKTMWLVLFLFLVLVTFPYLVAILSEGDDHVFGGFVINPQDGNSYLAKMEEGRRGDWKFSLPFTAEKSEGAYLFLFYIFLGHLSRLIGISPLLVFHIARILGAAFLIYRLCKFVNHIFISTPIDANRAFLSGSFGSGMGWLLLLAGVVTSDLWVAETYPFLSGFASPHFSFGMGLLLWMLLDFTSSIAFGRLLRLSIQGLLLSIVMPFGVVVFGFIGLIWSVVDWFVTRKIEVRPLMAAMIPGGSFLLYQYLAIQSDPLLFLWNQQNLTPSPPAWDLAISLMPALLLAVLGIFKIQQTSTWNSGSRLLVIWFLAGALMIYFPFDLQRRFMFSYFVPVSCLAIMGLHSLKPFLTRFYHQLFPAFIFLSVISNAFVILLTLFGVAQKSPLLFLTRDEVSAFEYLKASSPSDAVILCAPETGNLIPGWTGRRVIYGHEFESVNGEQNKAQVIAIYSGAISESEIKDFLQDKKVQLIIMGPREKKLGIPEFLRNRKPEYQNGTVEVFSW